jgi:vacuolar-type H+-ATPase subunit D/Vma8
MHQDPKAQIQKLNDMLQMLSNQRNAAQNECVQLGAEIISLQRRLAGMEKDATESLDVAKVALAVAKNGHDAEARA